jgi:hypothetical protein
MRAILDVVTARPPIKVRTSRKPSQIAGYVVV